MQWDQADLRRRLRERIIVDQILVKKVAIDSGVRRARLDELLSGGELGDDDCLHLHSYLHYRDEGEKQTRAKSQARNAGRYGVSDYKAFRSELKREFNHTWPTPSLHFFRSSKASRRLEIMRMEDKLKFFLRRSNGKLIREKRIILPDGANYWAWKEKIRRYAKAPVSDPTRLRPVRLPAGQSHVP